MTGSAFQKPVPASEGQQNGSVAKSRNLGGVFSRSTGFFVLTLLYTFAVVGSVNLLTGLISFWIPGILARFKIDGKAIETVGGKISFTLAAATMVALGLAGLYTRRRLNACGMRHLGRG